MTHIISAKNAFISNWQRHLVLLLIACVMSVFLLYGYMVRQTIVNVVEREKIGKETSTLLSSIGNLEAKYMSIREHINLDVAYARGFKDAGTPTFITRSALGKAATLSRMQ